jgi:putative hemolysin
MPELPNPTAALFAGSKSGIWPRFVETVKRAPVVLRRVAPKKEIITPRPVGETGFHAAASAPLARVDGYSASWAETRDEIEQAQRLRWQVFAQELGARLDSPVPGLDIDAFDAWCRHLLVKDSDGRVVGTYRALSPLMAQLCGSHYADGEFDLAALRPFAGRAMEVGRSCVHAEHRNGTVMLLLWQELARTLQRESLDLMFGCASVPLDDGGANARAVWRHIVDKGLLDHAIACAPRQPLPLDAVAEAPGATPDIPPLVKGYLRLGARVAGPPAWDREFGCADFLIILRRDHISPRYARHFFAQPVNASA